MAFRSLHCILQNRKGKPIERTKSNSKKLDGTV